MNAPFFFFFFFPEPWLCSFPKNARRVDINEKAIHLFGGFLFSWLANSSHRSKGKDKKNVAAGGG